MTNMLPTGKDETLKGVLLALAAFAAFSFSDASVKLIHVRCHHLNRLFLTGCLRWRYSPGR